MAHKRRDIRKQFLLDKTAKLAEAKGMSENEIVLRSIQSYLKRFISGRSCWRSNLRMI